MPLSKARDAERKRYERKAASLARWGLKMKREEEWNRLDKQLDESIQRGTMGDVLTPYRSISAISRLDKQLPLPAGKKPVQPNIDADGNVIPDYE